MEIHFFGAFCNFNLPLLWVSCWALPVLWSLWWF